MKRPLLLKINIFYLDWQEDKTANFKNHVMEDEMIFKKLMLTGARSKIIMRALRVLKSRSLASFKKQQRQQILTLVLPLYCLFF